MRKINKTWKYILASTFLVCLGACSNDMDDTPSFEDQEVSRAALVERTIVLTEPGTLQAKVEAAMGDEDVSTLQKLTLSGPFTGVDVQYWKTSLTNLVEFDLTNAEPKGVDGKNTYQDSNGDDVWLNENSVSHEMFSYMTKLEKLFFPKCTTWVGWAACRGCSSLMKVIIPESVTSFNSQVFENCTSLKTILLPSRISEINSYLFRGCSSLESIEIPESVTTIDWGAFYECKSLKEIKIPKSVTKLYGSVFHGCTFEYIEIPSNVSEIHEDLFSLNTHLKKIKIEGNITEIPRNTFSGCTSLEIIESTYPIKIVRERAFNDCQSLKDYTPFASVTEIYDYAFGGCAFETLDLSNVSVLSGNGIFNNCQKLKSVVLSKALTNLGDDIFANCTSLEKINLPEGLESIGSYAFAWTSIKEFNIPSTVKEIGNDAFQDTPITMLTIPASVTTVRGSLVDGCRNLKALVWNSTAEVRDIWNINHHPYLYLANSNTPFGPNWKNVIINGEAESITLCEGGRRDDSNTTYGVPIAFKAKKITFERQFDDWRWTHPGIASGWQTIVLPFTPTKIEHETKGVIAPFNSGVEGAKPFWLRSLTSEGFKDVTTLSPNVPYIIAMPNNDQYLEEYRLYGKIIFSAENIELGVTPETLIPSEGPDYLLQPTYQYVQAGPQVYALNYNYWIDGYQNGGAFARSSSDVYAFEAYVVPNGRSARSVFEMGTRTSATRTPYTPNKTGIPQIGDM